jgi:hypothetical protein
MPCNSRIKYTFYRLGMGFAFSVRNEPGFAGWQNKINVQGNYEISTVFDNLEKLSSSVKVY